MGSSVPSQLADFLDFLYHLSPAPLLCCEKLANRLLSKELVTDRFLGIIATLMKNKVENQVSAVQAPGVKADAFPSSFHLCLQQKQFWGTKEHRGV